MTKYFLVAILFFNSAAVFAQEYRTLECEITPFGKEPVKLQGRLLQGIGKTPYLMINETLSGFGQVTISQSEFRPEVLSVFIKTSDILGIHVQSQIAMTKSDSPAIGYFSFGSEVHSTTFIGCQMSL